MNEKEDHKKTWNVPEEKGKETFKDDKEPTIKSKVKDFCLETTAHGIGKIVKDDQVIWVKVLWLFILLVVCAGVLSHLAFVFMNYLEFKTHETTEILDETPEFPYVTICNSAAFSQNHTSQFAITENATNLGQFYSLLEQIAEEQGNEEGENAEIEDLLLSPEGIFANINSTTARRLGHYLKDLILTCTYMVQECDMTTDWIDILNSQYINCYTYTGGERIGSVATGINKGLSIILYLENLVASEAQYSEFFNRYSNTENAYGARLVVHEPGTLPSPEHFGIDIMPGHSTSVGIRETKVKQLQNPWGNCTAQEKLKELNRYRYDIHSCLSLCLIDYIERECGCTDYFNAMPEDFAPDTPMCRFIDNETVNYDQLVANVECSYWANMRFMKEYEIREACDCKEACTYRTYDLTVSQNTWPATRYQLDAFEKLILRNSNPEELLAYHQIGSVYADYATGASDGQYFSKVMYENFARVNVYFETQNILQRKQIASMELSDLLSNVGGTLGLWAGLSVVTFVEVISLLVSIIKILTQKCHKRKQNRIDNDTKAQN